MKNKENSIAVVISDFNRKITDGLLEGAKRSFDENSGKSLKVIRVPGAFEIPGTVKRIAQNLSFDAIVTLGAVIKGETKHFDFISSACTNGIQKLSMEFDIPIVFGVITTENVKQALDRSTKNNKGYEVMNAAFQMINTFKELDKSS